MSGISAYILGVVVAAVLCGIVTSIAPRKGTIAGAMKLIMGLLMTLAVLRPWVSISFDGLFGWTSSVTDEAESVVSEGKKMGENAYREGIKQRLESYILDKGTAMGTSLEVEITVAEEGLPVPVAASIKGALSPYCKETLRRTLTQELGIDEEALQWIG